MQQKYLKSSIFIYPVYILVLSDSLWNFVPPVFGHEFRLCLSADILLCILFDATRCLGKALYKALRFQCDVGLILDALLLTVL